MLTTETTEFATRVGETPVESSHTLELWIVCRNPDRVYRLDANKLNFESLAEHKTNSRHINLRLLLQGIVRHAVHAHLTPAANELLEHDKLTRFKSAEQLFEPRP